MSTNIHNGYRLVGVEAPAALFALLADLRRRLDVVYEAAYLRAVVEIAVAHADRLLLGDAMDEEMKDLPLADSSPLFCASFHIDRVWREVIRRGRRAPELDFQCEVFLYADPTSRSPLYGLLVTERDDYRQAWEETPGVEPWPYWNSTDRPCELSPQEWEDRRETWDRVLGRQGRMAGAMTWALLGDSHHISPLPGGALTAPFMPDRATRARWVARRRIVLSPLDTPGEEWRAAFEELAADIEPTLPDITPEMLRVLPGARP